MNNNHFVYTPPNYPGPIAIHAKVSKEMDEYHKNARIQVIINETSLPDAFIVNMISNHRYLLEKIQEDQERFNNAASQENSHSHCNSSDSVETSSALEVDKSLPDLDSLE